MHKRLRGVRASAAVLAATALLATAPAALGQEISPTDDEYGSTLELVSQGQRPEPPPGGGPGEASQPAPTATADAPAGGLPFTGLEVGGMLAAALALAGTGLILRRFARGRSADIGTS